MAKPDKKYNLKNRLESSGFTLIELLVAMATFSVVVVMVADIFLMGMGGTQRVFNSQAAQESGRFILESMSKEARMSKVNSLDGLAYSSLPNGVSGPYYSLNITNAEGQALDYVFNGAAKQSLQAGEILNPNDVETIGKFYLTKNAGLQPRLTIVFDLISKLDRVGSRATINLQTTVSSREYSQ